MVIMNGKLQTNKKGCRIMKLETLEPIVEKIMRTYPETQNNMFLLIARTYEALPNINVNESFIQLLLEAPIKKYPAFESITRVKRKIQEKYPELDNKKSRKIKKQKEKEYIEYARKW